MEQDVVPFFKTAQFITRLSFLLIFLAGGLTAIGQEPFNLPIFTVIGLAVVVYFFGWAQTVQKAFQVGFCFGLGYFLVLLNWIVQPFLVEASQTGWMAPFALVLLVAGISLFWALAFCFPYWIQASRLVRYIVLAGSWTGVEIIREHFLTGFPWGLLGYVWNDTPVAQAASLIGIHGLAALTLLIVILPIASKWAWPAIGISAFLFCLTWGYGVLRAPDTAELLSSGPTVRIVQPNVPQAEKWNPSKFDFYLDHLIELSNASSNEPVDLVIWPETALTIFPTEEDIKNLSLLLKGKPLVLGLRRIEDNKLYNSMGYIAANGTMGQVYDKRRLVPFGEFVPFEKVLKWLTLSPLASDEIWDFTPGDGSDFIDISGSGRFRALICYEAIFPHLVRTRERPRALLQITNDAWIGNLSGPRQHYIMAKFRAIELGLPLLRSSNPGVSAVVDGYGREVQSISLNRSGAIDSKVPEPLDPTLYSTVGDWPLLMTLLLGFGFLLVRPMILADKR